jgi:putative RNA 2'-phosphotransferase
MSKTLKSHSKFLSFVLRHRPEVIGSQLDSEGWAEVARLIELAKTRGVCLTQKTVLEVVATSDKQRFALSADRRRIRATCLSG